MIPKLRRKFISITATALLLAFLLVISAINGAFIFHSVQQLDGRLEMVMDDPGSRDIPPNDPESGQREKNFFPPLGGKLRIPWEGCLIFLDEDGTLKEIHEDAAGNYSREELSAIADKIFRQGRSKGWNQYFRFRMEKTLTPDGIWELKIGLLNASSDLYAMTAMLLISSITSLAVYLLVLLIIILASGRAVRPISESYARQKQFVTDAGHELKTPLTVISANNELSRMIYGQSEWFDGIDAQVTKMNSLIRSLITLAKMDEEEPLVFETFSLSDAVYDTAKSFEHLVHAKGKYLTLHVTDHIFCPGDESRLRQVVSILMDNAVKYCDGHGRIAVSLSLEKQIRLQVTNDFSRSQDYDLSQLFERFYRGDKARTPDGSYGLGLSIAKSIVEQHKGKIQARIPDPGRIMFEVLLPRNIKR